MGDLKQCKAGKNGVPDNIETGHGIGLVNSITVVDGGKIIVTPKTLYGIKSEDTYELIPNEINDRLTWKYSGGGVKKGYAN